MVWRDYAGVDRRGQAWHGMARRGKDWQAWHGMAGHGRDWQGKAETGIKAVCPIRIK